MRIVAALALLFAGLGCRGRGGPVVAKVGGLVITEDEFREKLADVAPDYQNYVLTPNGRRQFLDVLIREKMLLAAASDSGVPSSSDFKQEYARLKADEEAKLAQAREYLLIRLWRDELRKKGVLSVSDQEVQDRHRRHPQEVLIRHILLGSADEAETVLGKARSGQSFQSLAKAASLDAETAVDGGRMKPAVYGEIIPELEDVVFRMKVGETAGPIRSKFGYHVLKKEGERALPLAAAEPRIRLILEKQKLDQHLQTMQAKYPVEVVDAQFK